MWWESYSSVNDMLSTIKFISSQTDVFRKQWVYTELCIQSQTRVTIWNYICYFYLAVCLLTEVYRLCKGVNKWFVTVLLSLCLLDETPFSCIFCRSYSLFLPLLRPIPPDFTPCCSENWTNQITRSFMLLISLDFEGQSHNISQL